MDGGREGQNHCVRDEMRLRDREAAVGVPGLDVVREPVHLGREGGMDGGREGQNHCVRDEMRLRDREAAVGVPGLDVVREPVHLGREGLRD